MRPLRDILPNDIAGGINLLDLGASGQVPDYWRALAHLTNLIGFDPNVEECNRLNSTKSDFHAQQFLPYAIAGQTKKFTLYKTKNKYCWSLLEPNLEWQRRFSYSDDFEIESTDQISAYALDEVSEIQHLDVDAMKLDTQGLELPILTTATRFVDSCILIETETGFSENYKGETTFDSIAHHMSSLGFGLFDLNANHRVSRRNQFARESPREQMLWCEAVWLRDFLNSGSGTTKSLSRAKALKALCIYANHGCYSYGLEAAGFFRTKGLIRDEEFETLARDIACWTFPKREQPSSVKRRLLRSVFNVLPRRYARSIESVLNELSETAHPMARFLKK